MLLVILNLACFFSWFLEALINKKQGNKKELKRAVFLSILWGIVAILNILNL